MKKIVIRLIIEFVALWMGVAIILFVNTGLPLLNIVAEEVELPIYDRYIDRLETMAYPERAGDLGEAGKDTSFICMNVIMSDWIDMSEHRGFENVALVYNRLITDCEGNIIQNGVLAAVSSERRDGKSVLDDYAELLLVGYISVDDTFTKDQIKRIRELEDQYGSLAIEINSYTVKEMKYYPKRITIWNGQNMLERFDNLNPNEGEGSIGTKSVWISGVDDLIWSEDNRKYEGKEALIKWTKENLSTVFSEENVYSNSSVFGGYESYTMINDGRFAMVTRYAVDGKAIYKPIAVRCSIVAFVITAVTIGIIGVCIKVKRRFANL